MFEDKFTGFITTNKSTKVNCKSTKANCIKQLDRQEAREICSRNIKRIRTIFEIRLAAGRENTAV